MLPQETMIARLRQLCQEDERLIAGMLYGSFSQGEGDAYSDIECLLFFQDEALETLDPRAWVGRIAPLALYFTNEFGVQTAIFENLIRGEFHFDPASEMEIVETWVGQVSFPSLKATLLVDRTGELSRRLQAVIGPPPRHDSFVQVLGVIHRYVNWLVFGATVLARGELARALELLGMVQRHLLQMARFVEGCTAHWHIPSRLLEQDLSPIAYARYTSCTAALEEGQLWCAYRNAWGWGRELLRELAATDEDKIPPFLMEQLDNWLGSEGTWPPWLR